MLISNKSILIKYLISNYVFVDQVFRHQFVQNARRKGQRPHCLAGMQMPSACSSWNNRRVGKFSSGIVVNVRVFLQVLCKTMVWRGKKYWTTRLHDDFLFFMFRIFKFVLFSLVKKADSLPTHDRCRLWRRWTTERRRDSISEMMTGYKDKSRTVPCWEGEKVIERTVQMLSTSQWLQQCPILGVWFYISCISWKVSAGTL